MPEPENEGPEPENVGDGGVCEIQDDFELLHIISELIKDGPEMLRVLNRHIHSYRYSIV